jgi:hypothetical protein
LLHETEHLAEPKPGALAHLFRGEERLERAGLHRVAHADARVGDLDADVQIIALHADAHLAFAPQRVARVDGEIEDGIVELVLVRVDGASFVLDRDHQRMSATDDIAQERLECAHGVAHVEFLRIDRLLAGERQHAARDAGGLFGRGARVPQGARQLAVLRNRRRALDTIEVHRYDRQKIVEIMRDATCQLAEGLHLLRLAQHFLGARALR